MAKLGFVFNVKEYYDNVVDINIAKKWKKSTEEFLAHFPGSHIWATCLDAGSEKRFRHYYGSYSDVKDELSRDNFSQRAIFFTVNELVKEDNDSFRTKMMWKRSRAVFMDDDVPRAEGDYRTDWPLEPSLVVETSPGKFHYYWLIKGGLGTCEGYAFDEKSWSVWQSVERGIVSQYGGDKNVKDLSRVLRLPGYRHQKKIRN